jgi:HAD superfamily hydrolase (TIGR01490 family)
MSNDAATPHSEAGLSGQQHSIGAFFDMDYTILRGSSGRLYVRYLREEGRLSAWAWARIMAMSGLYAVRLMEFPALMARLTATAASLGEGEAWRTSQAWFDSMLRDYIADLARRRIADHLSQGDHVAIVSAATPYAVAPVAAELGLGDRYLATRLEVRAGRFTGRIVTPACYGPGKVTLVQEYAREHGIDLSRSFCYSDSHHDLPLLAAVGHPVAVNPSAQLRKIAEARGWPIVLFY